VYSEAFDGLPPDVKRAVYEQMQDQLADNEGRGERTRVSAEDRRAVLEILRDTKPDFPKRDSA